MVETGDIIISANREVLDTSLGSYGEAILPNLKGKERELLLFGQGFKSGMGNEADSFYAGKVGNS